MARTLSGSGALWRISKTIWHRRRQSSGGWDCQERPVARQWYHWEREHYGLRETGTYPDHGRQCWAGAAGSGNGAGAMAVHCRPSAGVGTCWRLAHLALPEAHDHAIGAAQMLDTRVAEARLAHPGGTV